MTPAAVGATTLDAWALGVSAVGTVATVGALVVAIVLGLRESHAVREENRGRDRERREEEQRRRRAQAECVSAELEVDVGGFQVSLDIDGERQMVTYYPAHVTVHNASALPIYDARTYMGIESREENSMTGVRFIPGGQSRRFQVENQEGHHRSGDSVPVRFRDAAGTSWERSSGGVLEERPQDEGWILYRAQRDMSPPTGG